ncbi:MAG: hypothetical protein K2J37_06655 [Ruminococcus sp.]|nr:hypothetical protein [Ruminococcus sp.]MDE6784186.1 hypothetical protein [Ruminococcus sp.]
MKNKKYTALIVAAAIPLSLCSCSLKNFGYDSSDSGSSTEEKTKDIPETAADKVSDKSDAVDMDNVNEKIEQLFDNLKVKNNKKAVQEDIDWLMQNINLAADRSALCSMDYYTDWYNEDLENEYDSAAEMLYVMSSAMGYAFSKGSVSEEYSELFENLVDDDAVEYFTQKGLNLARIEGYAQVDYNVSDSELDDYFDIAYDSELDDDEKNLKAAEVYLEILTNYDSETFYDNYNRDYEPELILELSEAVRKNLVPISGNLINQFSRNSYSEDIFNSPELPEDLFGTIREYAEFLSPEIKTSAERINDEKLYVIASGDECYTGSFTIDMPSENSAMTYIYSDGSYYDFTTAVHEFGHFHSSFSDETNAYLSMPNIDLAEIQSQGMELLFLQFYDAIYGRQADAMKLLRLSDITDAAVTGFLVGAFEYSALLQADELTPEDVLELYNDTLGDYAENYPFYYMSHIFESPGYYISYGVSALAALDMLDECMENPEAAVKQYEKISAVSINSRDSQFRSVLKECGFSDVLTEKYIEQTAENIQKFADSMR